MFLCQGISIQRDLSKDRIREMILKERDLLTKEEILRKSEEIQLAFLSSEDYAAADFLLVYVSTRSEVCTDRIIVEALKDGKRVFAPVPSRNFKENTMEFYEFFHPKDLSEGMFGIAEPPVSAGLFKVTEGMPEKTLMLVPGIAFDREKNRVGYGKGYYDHYLNENPGIHTIALAYDLQMVPFINSSPQDVPLDGILTEKEYI